MAIVHARWNSEIVGQLVSGARSALEAAGVVPANILVESVPGSYELPLACRKMIDSSSSSSSRSGENVDNDNVPVSVSQSQTRPIDAVIAIGVLIKGQTMHFEYIADSVSHGLMRVQLDTGTPVVFGLLTVLSPEQARTRAGMVEGEENLAHGWAEAAVEMGVKLRKMGGG